MARDGLIVVAVPTVEQVSPLVLSVTPTAPYQTPHSWPLP